MDPPPTEGQGWSHPHTVGRGRATLRLPLQGWGTAVGWNSPPNFLFSTPLNTNGNDRTHCLNVTDEDRKIRRLALFVTKRKLGLLTIKIRNLAPYLSQGQNSGSYGTIILKHNKLNSLDMLKFNAISNNFSKLHLVTTCYYS